MLMQKAVNVLLKMYHVPLTLPGLSISLLHHLYEFDSFYDHFSFKAHNKQVLIIQFFQGHTTSTQRCQDLPGQSDCNGLLN